MTKEEARALVDSLTEDQKIMLYRLLSNLTQNPSPAEPDPATD